jgi:Kelch motif protein
MRGRRIVHALPVLFAAACGFPDPGSFVGRDGGGPDVLGGPCSTCQLLALEPAVANTGDTVTLEGSFGSTATVSFPGAAPVTATVQGNHRATVMVPADATAGDLTVSTAQTGVGPLPFRRASFALGLQNFVPCHGSNLVTARFFHATVVVGNLLYVIGGSDRINSLDGVERATINADGSLGIFATVPGVVLGVPRSGATAVVIGRSVYVIGGANSSGPRATLERASINPDGSLGGFAIVQGVALATARSQHMSVVLGNSLYVLGGLDAGNAPLGSVERATIQPDGSLGPFAPVSGVALLTARSGATAAVVGASLYVVGGGGSSATLDTVERAAIDGDGSLGAFTLVSGVHLNTPRASLASAVVGSSLYVLGGFASMPTDSVEQAPINSDGSLGAFSTSSTVQLTDLHTGLSAVVARNYLYVVGGFPAGGRVERASINRSGALGAPATMTGVNWTNGVDQSSAVVGNTLYYVVGVVNGVYRAPIGADGSLGAPSPVSTQFASLRAGSTITAIGPYLYVVGGLDDNSLTVPAVERAPINADGSLGAFAPVQGVSLVTGRWRHASAVVGSYLYVISGISDGRFEPTVERATIGTDGSLGTFSTVSGVTVLTPRAHHAVAVVRGALYILGGDDQNQTSLSSVERATINADGSLATFATVSGLQAIRNAPSATVVGRYLYVIGGAGAMFTPDLKTIERATINADGSLTPFATSADMLVGGRMGHFSLELGNSLYIVGGTQATAEQAPLP